MYRIRLVFALMAAALTLPVIGASLHTGADDGSRRSDATPIPADAVDVYCVEFRGGEPAHVTLLGIGARDLNVYVYDDSGQLVASDTSLGVDCWVEWFPEVTAMYRIEVENVGDADGIYAIACN